MLESVGSAHIYELADEKEKQKQRDLPAGTVLLRAAQGIEMIPLQRSYRSEKEFCNNLSRFYQALGATEKIPGTGLACLSGRCMFGFKASPLFRVPAGSKHRV